MKLYTEHGKTEPYLGYERVFQKTAIRYLKKLGFFAIHVPNGGVRSKIEGKWLKEDGVTAGVPDILIFNPKSNCRGVAIELKVKGGKISDSQHDCLNELSKCHWNCYVVWGIDGLIDLASNNLI